MRLFAAQFPDKGNGYWWVLVIPQIGRLESPKSYGTEARALKAGEKVISKIQQGSVDIQKWHGRPNGWVTTKQLNNVARKIVGRGVEKAVRILNDLLVLDPVAINKLFRAQVAVNTKIADHPTVQVLLSTKIFSRKIYALRLLGLLNGILQDENSVVVVVVDEGDIIVEFRVGKIGSDRVVSS